MGNRPNGQGRQKKGFDYGRRGPVFVEVIEGGEGAVDNVAVWATEGGIADDMFKFNAMVHMMWLIFLMSLNIMIKYNLLITSPCLALLPIIA